jgi:hypothetical protein
MLVFPAPSDRVAVNKWALLHLPLKGLYFGAAFSFASTQDLKKMNEALNMLIEQARKIEMTPEQEREQRLSFLRQHQDRQLQNHTRDGRRSRSQARNCRAGTRQSINVKTRVTCRSRRLFDSVEWMHVLFR